MRVEPPVADNRGNEGGNDTANVDEYVENLEASVAFFLGFGQGFRTLLGLFGLEVVVQLTHHSLQVAFEKTVTAGDDDEGNHGENHHPGEAVSAEDGDGEYAVAHSHDNKARDNGALVVLGAAGQGKHIDEEVEYGEHDAGRLVGHTELRVDEQRQHGIHDVVAEALAHVAQCSGYESLWMLPKCFPHIEDNEWSDNNQARHQHE